MHETLKALVLTYSLFIQDLGSNPNAVDFHEKVGTLFSENVIKIENGKRTLEGQQALIEQLSGARKQAYPWTMEILKVVIDVEEKTAVLLFSWTSEKMGHFITSALLKFDENNKICEVNDVYNKFADLKL